MYFDDTGDDDGIVGSRPRVSPARKTDMARQKQELPRVDDTRKMPICVIYIV
jgi:hypothetical protein